jgi:hypothetical protein
MKAVSKTEQRYNHPTLSYDFPHQLSYRKFDSVAKDFNMVYSQMIGIFDKEQKI